MWVYQYQRTLDFILPGKPVEKSYIESFNDHAGRILYFDLVCFCGACHQATDSTSFRGSFRGAGHDPIARGRARSFAYPASAQFLTRRPRGLTRCASRTIRWEKRNREAPPASHRYAIRAALEMLVLVSRRVLFATEHLVIAM